MFFSEVLTAGVQKEITDRADFLRIVASAAEDIDLTFYLQGREVSQALQVGAGYSEQIDFDRVVVKSTGGGLTRIATRMGSRVGYDRAVGSVNITGTITTRDENGAFTQAAPAVGLGDTQVLAANANRRYLMLQNNHATAVIYVQLDGAAANTNTGFKLSPGQPLEIQGRAPTGAIRALSTVAIVANTGGLIVSEG